MPIMKTCITDHCHFPLVMASAGENGNEVTETTDRRVWRCPPLQFPILLKLPVTKLCHQFPINKEILKRMIGDNDNDVAGIPNCPTPNVPPLTQLSSLLHTTFTFTCFFNIFDQQDLDREGDGAKGRMKILQYLSFVTELTNVCC